MGFGDDLRQAAESGYAKDEIAPDLAAKWEHDPCDGINGSIQPWKMFANVLLS